MESLGEFGRLEEIEMPVSFLLSYKEFDIRKHIWKFEDLNLGRLGVKLPVVLKKLKLYVYQTWEVDFIVMELEKMLRDKGTLVPGLTLICIECWTRSWGICAEKTKELYGLVIFGAKHGVHVEVIIDVKSR